MRRFILIAAAMIAIGTGALVAQKASTPQELDKVMKRVGPAMQAVQKAVGSGDFKTAKAQLEIVEKGVADSQNFWIVHKRDDAVKLNKASLAQIDVFEKVLSQENLDNATATAAYKQTGGTCRACHQVYRVEDAENNYMLKPGSVPGVGE